MIGNEAEYGGGKDTSFWSLIVFQNEDLIRMTFHMVTIPSFDWNPPRNSHLRNPDAVTWTRDRSAFTFHKRETNSP